MSKLIFSKVTALPETLVGNTCYIVKPTTGLQAELYFTSSDGTSVYHLPNKNDIQAMIESAIAAIPGGGSGVSEVIFATNIADRDSKVFINNAMVLVQDATADLTVGSGSALYFYNAASTSYYKIAEYESMDLVFNWNTLLNKPTSSVAEIDEAVSMRHEHANIEILSALGKTVDNTLTFLGQEVAPSNLAEQQW